MHRPRHGEETIGDDFVKRNTIVRAMAECVNLIQHGPNGTVRLGGRLAQALLAAHVFRSHAGALHVQQDVRHGSWLLLTQNDAEGFRRGK